MIALQVARRFEHIDTGHDGAIDERGARELIKQLHHNIDSEELELAIQGLETRKERIVGAVGFESRWRNPVGGIPLARRTWRIRTWGLGLGAVARM